MRSSPPRSSVVGGAAGLALYALSDSIVFFYSPSEVAAKAPQPGARLRVGGLVKTGSVVKSAGETIAFVVTDGAHDLRVSYQGLLPDLFREGQGVVAEGGWRRPTKCGRTPFSPSTTSAICRARSSRR